MGIGVFAYPHIHFSSLATTLPVVSFTSRLPPSTHRAPERE